MVPVEGIVLISPTDRGVVAATPLPPGNQTLVRREGLAGLAGFDHEVVDAEKVWGAHGQHEVPGAQPRAA
eukprot:960656-Pyramimonas_sp.AAC.1